MSTSTVTKFADKAVAHSEREGVLGYGTFEVDFAAVGNNVVIPDGDTCTIQIAPVKKNTLVKRVRAVVETVHGSALSGEVGDGADPNGYITSLDLNALGYTKPAGQFVTDDGKLYGANDTIDLVIANSSGNAYNLNTGKVKLIVEYVLTKGDIAV